MAKSIVEPATEVVLDLNEKTPIQVLHVDDEPGLLKAAKQILEMQGLFHVETASSVEEAMERMKKKPFDVIVSDYVMPGKDGLQFLRRLREEDNNIPFIIFTGKGREEVAIKALNLGADQYLNKGGSPETVYGELAHGIRKVVERKRAQEMLKESEERHRTLLDMANILIQSVNAEGRFVYVNKKWKKILGYTEKDLQKITMMDVIRKDQHKHCMDVFRQVMEGKSVRDVGTVFVAKDGREIIVSGNAMPRFKDGRFASTVGFFADITERKKAEEALLESEERFRSIVENSHDGIVIIDDKFTITYANDEASHIIGYSKNEIIGQSFMKFLAEESKVLVQDRYLRRQRGESVPSIYEFEVVHKDGQRRNVEIKSTVLRDSQERVQTVAQMLDITGRKKIEERYRDLIENEKDIIYTLDDKGNVTFANPAVETILGYRPEEVIGKNFMVLIPAEWRKKAEADFSNTLKTGEMTAETVLLDKKGQPHFVEFNSTVIREDNKVVGTRGIIRDITERKHAEEELKQAEEKHRILLDTANVLIQSVNAEGKFVYVNKEWKKVLGYTRKDLQKITLMDVIRRDHHEYCMNVFKQVTKGKSAHDVEAVFVAKDGREVMVRGNARPVFKDSEFVSTVGFFVDVTERKRAEEALLGSEEKFRNLAEQSPNMIFINKKGRIVYANKKCEEIMGYKKEELYSPDFNFLTLIAPEYIGLVKTNFSGHMKGEEVAPYEHALITKEGKKIEVIQTSKLIKHEGESAFLGIITDITELKKMEEALRESEEKFRDIFESANDGIILLNRSGSILDVNEKASEMFGGSKEKLLGKHFTKVGIFSLKDIPRLMANFANIIRGKKSTITLDIKNKKDQQLFLECSASLIKGEGKPAIMIVVARNITERKEAEKAIRESQEKFERLFINNPEAAVYVDSSFRVLDINPRFRELFGYSLNEIEGKHIDDIIVPTDKIEEAEILNNKATEGYVYQDTVRKRKDGSLVSVSISAAPITVEDTLTGYVAVYKDISQLKRTEKQLKETLEKVETMNEKLGVVGKLARHDARNKLSTVTMNTFLAKQKLADHPEVLEYLSEIESAVQQTERIFDFARIYEKLGMEELTYMDVEKSLKEAAMLFSDLHNIKVLNDCYGLTVLADSLLRQILYNLIDNSLKHGERVSQIRLHCKETGKDQLKLIYEDDGIGIPKVEKEKIFKEGYGKGTGYGLYLIKKMCEVYGWTIQEMGKQGKGVQFIMTIPKTGENGKINYKLH